MSESTVRQPLRFYGRDSDWTSLAVIEPDEELSDWMHGLSSSAGPRVDSEQLDLASRWTGVVVNRAHAERFTTVDAFLQTFLLACARDLSSTILHRRVRRLESEFQAVILRLGHFRARAEGPAAEAGAGATPEDVTAAMEAITSSLPFDGVTTEVSKSAAEPGEPDVVARVYVPAQDRASFREQRRLVLDAVHVLLTPELGARLVIQVRRQPLTDAAV